MRALAQQNSTISFKLGLTRQRRPRLFSLVNRKIMVPSSAEFMRVNNATVREGSTHRVWPPEVLRQFQLADVVKTDVQHYVLRDRSISPVR
ncbi:MAG TPA: hypothetical protein VFT02_02165 [Pyrinomonadaceae bacterium]|nr:hypothetical protein [Pyrinomonadaceae bacterium]